MEFERTFSKENIQHAVNIISEEIEEQPLMKDSHLFEVKRSDQVGPIKASSFLCPVLITMHKC